MSTVVSPAGAWWGDRSHLTVLGVNLQGDGGALFAMGLIVLATSSTGLSSGAGNSHLGTVFKTSEERIEVAGTG